MSKKEMKEVAINLFATDTMPVAMKRRASGGRADETAGQILQVFAKAREVGKTELSSKEVTLAYLRMFAPDTLAKMDSDDNDARELAYKVTHSISCKLFTMTYERKVGEPALKKSGRGLFAIND
jgi:hypothetical protein